MKKENLKINILLVLSGLTVVLLLVLHSCSSPKQSTVVDEVLAGGLQDSTNEESIRLAQEAGMFTVEVRASGTMSGRILQLGVANSTTNNKDCYFEILVENNVIYKSPTLCPGQHIDKEQVNIALPAGEHRAVVRYYILSGSEHLGNADVETIIQCVGRKKQ